MSDTISPGFEAEYERSLAAIRSGPNSAHRMSYTLRLGTPDREMTWADELREREENLRLECLRLFYAPEKEAKQIVDGAKTFYLFVKGNANGDK